MARTSYYIDDGKSGSPGMQRVSRKKFIEWVGEYPTPSHKNHPTLPDGHTQDLTVWCHWIDTGGLDSFMIESAEEDFYKIFPRQE